MDAINPGREGFYEESRDFLTLSRRLRGDGEKVGGYLGRTIDAVLKRSQAKSALNSTLSRVAYIRCAMDDVSAGITHLMTEGGKQARAIREMLKSNTSHPNGLASAKPAGFDIPIKVAGMPVNQARRLSEAATIDYEKALVTIDVSRLNGITDLYYSNGGSTSSTNRVQRINRSLKLTSTKTLFSSTGAMLRSRRWTSGDSFGLPWHGYWQGQQPMATPIK